MGRDVEPGDEEVTGFVFKVQANMDPNHRDRVAFLRLASGQFRRNMKLKQSGTGKTHRRAQSDPVLRPERETVDEAWPGDIIGIPNHGVLRVGDTLSESGNVVFTGIPNFAPEILRRVRLADPMKQKHLARALESLAEEGVTQVFKPPIGCAMDRGRGGPAAARCAEVAAGRDEYGLDADLEASPYDSARWLQGPEAGDREIRQPPIAAAWPRTATARRCSWPRAPGNSAMSRNDFRNVKLLKTRERHDVHAE